MYNAVAEIMSTLFYIENTDSSIEFVQKTPKFCDFFFYSRGWNVAFFSDARVRSIVPAWYSLRESRMEQRYRIL